MFSKNLPYQWLHLGFFYFVAFLGMICSLSSLIAFTSNCAKAEIVPDKSLGNDSSVVIPLGSNFDSIEGGATRGTNLFHSFEKFNIDKGRRAFFRIPKDIENIITRVTGGSRSEILGTLGVFGSANLFLINPNGIFFGENSQVSLAGSFVATTANAIGFGDEGIFSALLPEAPPLLKVNPSALIFNQLANQPITLQSKAKLQLSGNKSLFLVGGDVNLEGAELLVRGGRINLGGLAGAGTVELNIDDNNLGLSFPNDAAPTDISLTNGATLRTNVGRGTTSGLNNGDIQIQARHLKIDGGSIISASTFGAQPAGTLTIKASESIEVTGGSRLLAETFDAGVGGELTIETPKLIVRDGSDVAAGAFKEGSAGKLTVTASEVEVSGTSEDGTKFSKILTQTDGAGNAGKLTINTLRLTVQNGAIVSARTLGKGNAGNLTIKTGNLSIKNGAQITSSSTGEGSAGNVEIEAESINLDQGNIISQTALGNGGNITLSLKDLLVLRDRSKISSTAGTAQAGGDGGNITINAKNGFIIGVGDGNSDITANAFSGKGGEVNIEAIGIFGITPRSREELVNLLQPKKPKELDANNLQTNDITAISQQNPDLSGELNINTVDNDPSSTEELPTDIVDLSRLLEQNLCEASQDNEFIITGRGGIPPSPTEALEADAGWEDLRIFPHNRSNIQQRQRKTKPKVDNHQANNKKNPPLKIVEAKGWIVDSNGDIIFTAHPPSAYPHSSALNYLNCHSFKLK